MNYNEAVARSIDEPVAILFTAVWCGPCKTTKPVVERLSREMAFPLVQLDADENKALLMELGIRGVPALVTLNKQQITGKFMGGKTEQQLRAAFEQVGMAPKAGLEFDL